MMLAGLTIRSGKPPVDLDLRSSVILPRQSVATVMAHQLPELSEQSQREVFTIQMIHPVAQAGSSKSCSLSRNLSDSPSDLPAISLGQ